MDFLTFEQWYERNEDLQPDPNCSECGGYWGENPGRECKQCDGTGECICACGDMHDCKACNAAGVFDCQTCGPRAQYKRAKKEDTRRLAVYEKTEHCATGA